MNDKEYKRLRNDIQDFLEVTIENVVQRVESSIDNKLDKLDTTESIQSIETYLKSLTLLIEKLYLKKGMGK